MSHTIKDSGERRQYSTGAQRDRGDIKPRPDLIHPYFTFRVGLHLGKGAIKYDEWNWYKGMPLSDWYASLKRHVEALGMGLNDEDHLSAIAFNVMGYMITELGIKTGKYPKEFDDMQNHTDMHDAFLNMTIVEEPAKEGTEEVIEENLRFDISGATTMPDLGE